MGSLKKEKTYRILFLICCTTRSTIKAVGNQQCVPNGERACAISLVLILPPCHNPTGWWGECKITFYCLIPPKMLYSMVVRASPPVVETLHVGSSSATWRIRDVTTLCDHDTVPVIGLLVGGVENGKFTVINE